MAHFPSSHVILSFFSLFSDAVVTPTFDSVKVFEMNTRKDDLEPEMKELVGKVPEGDTESKIDSNAEGNVEPMDNTEIDSDEKIHIAKDVLIETNPLDPEKYVGFDDSFNIVLCKANPDSLTMTKDDKNMKLLSNLASTENIDDVLIQPRNISPVKTEIVDNKISSDNTQDPEDTDSEISILGEAVVIQDLNGFDTDKEILDLQMEDSKQASNSDSEPSSDNDNLRGLIRKEPSIDLNKEADLIKESLPEKEQLDALKTPNGNISIVGTHDTTSRSNQDETIETIEDATRREHSRNEFKDKGSKTMNNPDLVLHQQSGILDIMENEENHSIKKLFRFNRFTISQVDDDETFNNAGEPEPDGVDVVEAYHASESSDDTDQDTSEEDGVVREYRIVENSFVEHKNLRPILKKVGNPQRHYSHGVAQTEITAVQTVRVGYLIR